MAQQLRDIFLVMFLLVCGMGSYWLLYSLTDLSYSLVILMAIGCRTLSLLLYRSFSSLVREILAWQVFEWTIPVVLLAELIIAACGLGDGKFATFGLFII